MRPALLRPLLLPSYALLFVLTVAACARVPEPGASEDSPAPDAETTATAEVPSTDVGPSDAETEQTEPNPAPAAHAPPAPTLTTFREGDGATASLTFRSDAGVAVSDEAPLLLVVDGDTLTAPLTAGPARFTEPGGAVVDQASYHLDAETFHTLVNARVDAVTVRVAHGDGYASYPYLSGDLVE